jgi:hypothetical protein
LHQLELVAAQAEELGVLRAKTAAEPAGRDRPASGLAPRIGATLGRCGLQASSLSSFTPESETLLPVAEGQTRLMRQRATLVLGGLTLPQLGAFLEAWRSAEPAWIAIAIEVSPASSSENNPAGGDLPLRTVVTVETTYNADAVQGSHGGGAD